MASINPGMTTVSFGAILASDSADHTRTCWFGSASVSFKVGTASMALEPIERKAMAAPRRTSALGSLSAAVNAGTSCKIFSLAFAAGFEAAGCSGAGAGATTFRLRGSPSIFGRPAAPWSVADLVCHHQPTADKATTTTPTPTYNPLWDFGGALIGNSTTFAPPAAASFCFASMKGSNVLGAAESGCLGFGTARSRGAGAVGVDDGAERPRASALVTSEAFALSSGRAILADAGVGVAGAADFARICSLVRRLNPVSNSDAGFAADGVWGSPGAP